MQQDTQTPAARQAPAVPHVIAVTPIPNLPADRLDEAALANAFGFAQSQLNRSASELSPSAPGQYPKSTKTDGTWNVLPATGDVTVLVGWTQGFFPGLLWYQFQRTNDATWSSRAKSWTQPLSAQQYNMLSHDNGFKFMPSFGVGYQLTNDATYRQTALAAAGSMASRYNPRVGIISCCDWADRDPQRNWRLPLVTDTMVDLELLFWGATQNQITQDYQGQEGWRDMALNHALTTLRDMVRTDGSTYHVIDYDPLTGNIRSKQTFQGYNVDSTWARGHTWAMYGYTMAYRYTGDSRMLDAAQRVTDYYLNRVPADMVPNWDFDAPTQQKDSSAAAIAASALIELTTKVTDATRRQRYWKAAVDTLRTLMSSAYLAQGTPSNRAILLHGVGHYPAGQEINVGLIYGDYYFLEALLRYRVLVPQTQQGWVSKLDFSQCVFSLGTGNTGVRTVEFDVTPQGSPIDGVVGYADSSTNVTAYSSLALLVRMNPTGIFDVRNGANYAFQNRVTYSAGTRYHIRISADMNAKRYSVWVRSGGGSEVQLASNYAFRSDAPTTDDLGKVAVKSGNADGEFIVENHTVR
ncbi:glycoside hydrolase family 88 protein [Myxococcaceae bacterium GXIMD 01537]